MTSDINAYLVADTATHDVIGDRIYWADAPQRATMPYMSYFVTDDPHSEFTFTNLDAGQAMLSVNIYSSNRFTALSVGNTVRDRLEMYQGAMNNTTMEYIRCGGVRVSKLDDNYRGTFDMMVNYYGD